jgi:hypothetical protein
MAEMWRRGTEDNMTLLSGGESQAYDAAMYFYAGAEHHGVCGSAGAHALRGISNLASAP